MERTLRTLFDFQKFAGNAALNNVIDSAHAKFEMQQRNCGKRELSLDEMEWLAAAGTPDQLNKKDERH